MAVVEIYTKQTCPYCHRAKALLDQKGVVYQEIAVDHDADLFESMKARAQARTVPQIFINDQGVGGCDDLYALDQAGKLDPLLAE